MKSFAQYAVPRMVCCTALPCAEALHRSLHNGSQPEQAQQPRWCQDGVLAAAGEMFLRQLIARIALRVAQDMQQPSAGQPASGYAYGGDAVDGQAWWLTAAPAQMTQEPSTASQLGGREMPPSQRPLSRRSNTRPRSA